MVFYVSKFIENLYSLLNEELYTDIISWNEDGTCVCIKNPMEFSKVFMPNYFNTANLHNFTRQLNRYNFIKVSDNNVINNQAFQGITINSWVYTNAYFIRGRDDLLVRIVRKENNVKMAEEIEDYEKLDEGMQISLFNNYTVNTLETITSTMEKIVLDIKQLKHEISEIKDNMHFIQSPNVVLIFDENEKDACDLHHKLCRIGYFAFFTTEKSVFEDFIVQGTYKFIFIARENRDFSTTVKRLDKTQNTPIIVTTSSQTQFNNLYREHKNINGVIAKPFELIDLQHLISKTINQWLCKENIRNKNNL